MQIEGKAVFITGGGGGIGGGIATAFAERGCRIILADINENHAHEEAARLPSGTEVAVLRLDVTDPESWHAARTAAEERFGGTD